MNVTESLGSKLRVRLVIASAAFLLARCSEAPPRPAVSAPAPRGEDAAQATSQAQARDDRSAPPAYFEELVTRARNESHSAGQPLVRAELPPSLRNLDYEAYRTIRYRPERSLWRGEPGRFEVQFFHMGLHYHEPIQMRVLEGTQLHPFTFSPELFSYDGVSPPPPDARLGFAGFRLHAPLNTDAYRDEVLVFQGASYFRSVAKGQVYGLSGRALAIDTGEPVAEEFPRFTEFVLVRPGPDDPFMWILGYLESPRANGAYAFRVQPGDPTIIEVTARVFLRGPVKVLGIAPLTSMFLYGEEAPARFGGDHPQLKRPEAHDSDNLVTWSRDGEWLARPLRNPPRTHVSTFRLDSPRGFGLQQRDRDPDSYGDPEYAYERRPSAWIEPLGEWGPGSMRLLEIGTQLESDDNVGAMWVPDSVPKDGLSLRYRMYVGAGLPAGIGPSAQTIGTRFADAGNGRTRLTVEFGGPGLAKPSKPVEAVVTVAGGKLLEQQVQHDPNAARCALSFVVARDGPAEVGMRAFLRAGSDVLSETWTYQLPEQI